MAAWSKEEIVLPSGDKAPAQMPIIVSASRSTDMPAFYADWFMERLRAGYVKWYNPFNGVPLYVSFDKARLFVFWSKNPAPMLAKLSGLDESPIDILEREGRNYYFQFTMNDYDAEKIEPNVPKLDERIRTFKELSGRISHHARDRIVWRFDPLVMTDALTPKILLERIRRIGDQIAPYTSRLVFSFIDIKAYAKVAKNLERGGIAAREFTHDEMLEIASGIASMTKEWNMTAGTCGELADLPGIEHNRCVDDRLMLKCFSHDAALMKFIGAKCIPGNPLFGEPDTWELDAYKKDSGQRAACGCTVSRCGAQKIAGCFGSGKTTVLVERAINAFKRTHKPVLILTYNISLRNHIEHVLTRRMDAKWSSKDFVVLNIHQFIRTHGLPFVGGSEKNVMKFLADGDDALKALLRVQKRIGKYKTILVDECQDYEYAWLEILRQVYLAEKGEYVLFGDEKQNIYGRQLAGRAAAAGRAAPLARGAKSAQFGKWFLVIMY